MRALVRGSHWTRGVRSHDLRTPASGVGPCEADPKTLKPQWVHIEPGLAQSPCFWQYLEGSQKVIFETLG